VCVYNVYVKFIYLQFDTIGIASILITMETIEGLRIEIPEYPLERFVSDIGGRLFLPCILRVNTVDNILQFSFGLFLGISAATIVGFCEFCCASLLNYLHYQVIYCTKSTIIYYLQHTAKEKPIEVKEQQCEANPTDITYQMLLHSNSTRKSEESFEEDYQLEIKKCLFTIQNNTMMELN